MKVRFVTSSLAVGGAERQLVLLAEGLAARGHDVKVISIYPLPDRALKVDQRVSVVSLERRGRWDLSRALWRLERIVRRERPDVVHSYLIGPNLATALLPRRLTTSKLVWGIRASQVDLSQYGRISELSFALATRASRRADLIIANSEAGCHHHVAVGYPADRMMVIPNGIDTKLFCIDPERRDLQRLAWGVTASDGPVVGLVGRVVPVKDHRTFLEAVERLLPRHPRLRAVCVGGGDPEILDDLRRWTNERGLEPVVVWQEASKDMTAVYNGFDVLCQSSRSEGFPNVVGEAMACGVPCVVTDVGDSARIVGPLGAVVPPGDVDAMARALTRQLAQRGGEASAACRARIVEAFPVERMVERTEVALRELIGQ